MDNITIKHELKKFLSDSFKVKEINNEDNIFNTGIVHSLFFIQLLIFIEKKFKIELMEDEFDISNLTNINAIANVIANKMVNV